MSDNDFNKQVVEEFRANDGKVGGYFAEQDVLLLTTTGARSGQPRLIPLVYTKSGDDYVVLASKAGADTHPDWYFNLRANSDATVEVGTESFQARARVTVEPERTELYTVHETKMPGFKEYREGTSRQIPVIVLERAG